MKKDISPAVVIIIVLVALVAIAGVYFESTEIKPARMWTKEETQRKMAETQKKFKAEKDSSPVAPAPPATTKP